jgi:hypothetical protein
VIAASRGKELVMLVRRLWAMTVIAVVTAGCTSILGDFSLEPDATTNDSGAGGVDGPSDAGSADATMTDSRADSDAADAGRDGNPPRDATPDMALSADAACAAGLALCDGGCMALDATSSCGSCNNDCILLASAHVASTSIGCTGGRCTYTCISGYADCADAGLGCASLADAAANCGACGHDCHGGACTAATCGAYIIAQQPTTGVVAKLATDGRRVLWSDTGIVAIEQIAATGGSAIALAPASPTYGAVGSELALAGSTVAFSYLGKGSPPPSVGLAAVDIANSGTSAIQGAAAVNAVSLNAAATRVFFVNVSGTQGFIDDCPISGRDAGPCVEVGGAGRFLAQTAADSLYMFFNLTAGATTEQPGLYIVTISTQATSIFSTDQAQSLANDGSWAYWTQLNDGASTYAIYRTLESAPGTVLQTVVSAIASRAFATDGVNVYYWTGSAVASKPVGGGAETTLAPASSFVQIAVGGGLLVWTDGTTIWGLVLR